MGLDEENLKLQTLWRPSRTASGRLSNFEAWSLDVGVWNFPLQTISRTRSSRMVVAIFIRSGSPRASDLARWTACFGLILGGIGGSKGSTTASTTTGPLHDKAVSKIWPQAEGSVTLNPTPPQARAKAAKSIG